MTKKTRKAIVMIVVRKSFTGIDRKKIQKEKIFAANDNITTGNKKIEGFHLFL